MIDDRAVEGLLRRYRPVTRMPILTLRPSRTWPWAFAAAVLLVLGAGLHGLPDVDKAAVRPDAERVNVILDELADTPHADMVASWIAYREAIDEQSASEAHDGALIDRMPELR